MFLFLQDIPYLLKRFKIIKRISDLNKIISENVVLSGTASF